MKGAIVRIGLVFAFAVILFSLISLSISMLEVPALDLLGDLYWNWVWANTAERAMGLLPAITVFTMLMSVGVVISPFDLKGALGLIWLVKLIIAITLIAAAVHVVFSLALMPAARSAKNDAVAATALVRHYRARHSVNLGEGRFPAARRNASAIGVVVPSLDEEVRTMLRAADEAEADAAERAIFDSEQDVVPARRAAGQTATQRYERARTAMERGDWFTAHLYGRQAFDLDPRLASARELADEAWNEIERAAREDDRTELFERKRGGLRALTEGRSIEAYYLFRELHEEHPDDQDVRRYLAESRNAVSDIAFFIEEGEELAGLPGESDVVYVQESEDYRFEIFQFDRLIGSPAASYAVGLNAIGVDEDGGAPIYHLRAPFARVVDRSLALRGLHPDRPDSGTDAEYLRGSRPEGLQSLLPLQTGARQLLRIARAQGETNQLNAADLLRIYDDPAVARFVRESATQELLRRLLAPFTLVIAALLAAAVAYTGRSRYADRPPLFALLLIPIPGLAAVLFVELIGYVNTVLAGLLLIALPLAGVVATVLIVQGVLIVLALLTLVHRVR